MAENFANNYSTALDGAIDASQTTFDVLSVGGAPAVNFRIKVENELMLVTGVASLTLTVTRGIEGTTGASHADGTLVTHVVTAGSLSGMMASATVEFNGTNPSTANTSFEDLGEFDITLTTGARRCLCIFTAMGNNSNAGASFLLDIAVDGTRIGGDVNGVISVTGTTVSNLSFSLITGVLTAGSHTFKVQGRVTANTGGIQAGDSDRTPTFTVIELPITV